MIQKVDSNLIHAFDIVLPSALVVMNLLIYLKIAT